VAGGCWVMGEVASDGEFVPHTQVKRVGKNFAAENLIYFPIVISQ
jgi:hypothetical protein